MANSPRCRSRSRWTSDSQARRSIGTHGLRGAPRSPRPAPPPAGTSPRAGWRTSRWSQPPNTPADSPHPPPSSCDPVHSELTDHRDSALGEIEFENGSTCQSSQGAPSTEMREGRRDPDGRSGRSMGRRGRKWDSAELLSAMVGCLRVASKLGSADELASVRDKRTGTGTSTGTSRGKGEPHWHSVTAQPRQPTSDTATAHSSSGSQPTAVRPRADAPSSPCTQDRAT